MLSMLKSTPTVRGPYPCRVSKDMLVWSLWHSLLKRLPEWAALEGRGVKHGMEWKDCPGCCSTLCKDVVP